MPRRGPSSRPGGYMVVDDAADWLGLDEVERKVVEGSLLGTEQIAR